MSVSTRWAGTAACFLLGLLAWTAPCLLEAAGPYALSVAADRPAGVYRVGETARFAVSATEGGQPWAAGGVTYVVDDFVARGQSKQWPQGAWAPGESIDVVGVRPGFVRCQVQWKTPEGQLVKATAAAAFAPLEIAPGLPAPDDFDAFWSEQKAELAKIPLDPQWTKVAHNDDAIDCFDVQVACQGAPVSGYFARPKTAGAKSLPAVLWVHGAGVRSSSLGNAVRGARAGMLSLDINAHGIPNGRPAEFYKELSGGDLKAYPAAGRESRDTIYFRGMYLRLKRAIDFLASQPEWDGEIVAVIGHSQGGGQALAAGGLDERVTFVASGVPALCDHSGSAADRVNGWPKIVPLGADGKPDPKAVEAARYIDAVNFAGRCRAEAIMSVGWIDAVCPPSSCYAAYNQLRGPKRMLDEREMGHAAPPAVQAAFWDAVQRHVRRRQSRRSVELSAENRARCLEILRAAVADSESFWPSIHAAEALTLAGYGDEVRQSLAKRLKDERDDQRRCGLARELARAGDWMRSQVMLDILASDDPHGHVHAAESLYKIAELGDGRALRAAAGQSENGILRLMAAGALVRGGNLDMLSEIRQSLTAQSHDERRIAAWLLARIGSASDAARIREALPAAEEGLERAFMEYALAALGDIGGRAALLENLSSEHPDIRTYAAVFAADARMLDAAPQLEKMLDDKHLDAQIRAAQTLLTLSQPAEALGDDSEGDGDGDRSQLVFEATAEHPRYTEGAVLRTRDGGLLCAVTQFIGDDSDFARARIVARRSADQGRTWSAPEVLQETTGKLNVMSVTLRRMQDGGLGMFYLQKNGFSDLKVYLRKSNDEGRTFAAPTVVTSAPGYHVMNNDRVARLRNGRLLVPVATTADVRTENHFVSKCWMSDDDGATWRQGAGHVDQPQRGAMEPEVVELQDGRVLMIVRTQLGFVGASYSSDQGDTWGEPFPLPGVTAPEAPSTLRRIPATGDLLLIWNNTFSAGQGHGGKRTPLTAAVSADEGRTWTHLRNLETRPDRTYSYVSLTFVQGRAVMSYWDHEGRHYSSRFRSLPVTWFYQDP